ncbi:hypothetical protein F4776DRAFT_648888 [Hypoxylon sp. NC0597]|nr:hypothetical protein F4776DRAFT_648888 [Hypoxylon sp. NC0597]
MMSLADRSQFEPERDRNGRNVKHYTIPKYAPVQGHKDVRLHRNAYRARDLLNHAVIGFHNRGDDDLRKSQITACKNFTSRFEERKRAYGGRLTTVATLVSFQDDIRYFFDQLDEFFFFRLLGPHVRVDTGVDIVGEDPLEIDDRIEGETFPTKTRDRSYIQININTSSGGEFHKLDAIVGQLMHEMVHAYFLLFACDCPKCSRDVLNTVGVKDDGHGPLFLMLHRLILSNMRTWGKGKRHDGPLADLLSDDCPGQDISKSADRRATEAMKRMTREESTTLSKFRLHNNPKTPLIVFNKDRTKVIVNPSLTEKQLEWENSLRDRIRRDKEKMYRGSRVLGRFNEADSSSNEKGEKTTVSDDDTEDPGYSKDEDEDYPDDDLEYL